MQSGTASAVLGGAVGLDKTTSGTVTLSGANTYTGVTTVSAGTLVIGANAPSGSAGALGNASSEVVLGVAGGSNDASILIGGAFTVGRIIRIPTTNTTDAGTRVLTLGGNTADESTFSGNIFLGTTNQAGRGVTLTAASGGQVTFSGVIQNPSGMDATAYTVTKSGLGTVVLSGANTYTGTTAISTGALRASNNTALGTTASGTTIASGAALELAGGITIGAEDITSVAGSGVNNTGAIRNMSGTNILGGDITLADVAAVKIASDAGTLTLSGDLLETGATVKTLTFGGAGGTTLTGAGSSNSAVNITKIGIGSLTTTGTAFNDLSGGTVTVSKGTLNLDYGTSVASKLDDGSVLALSGGTVNLQNGGSAHTEVVASTTINAGASNVTQTSGTSVLRMNVITRNAGGTINFGAASIAQTDTATTNGILGTWATVGGTAYATTAVAAGADRPIIALAAYGQTVTRLASGTKVIANTSTNHVQITDGTGGAADITLAAATTAIATLTNNATGGTSTIDPNSQTLRTGGILLPNGSGALNIGNGTNNGTLTAATAGGELVIQNFSTTNDLTVNSVIANFTPRP